MNGFDPTSRTWMDLPQRAVVARRWNAVSSTYPAAPLALWHFGSVGGLVDTIGGVTLTDGGLSHGESILGVAASYFPDKAAYVASPTPPSLRMRGDMSATMVFAPEHPGLGGTANPDFLFGHGGNAAGSADSNSLYAVGLRNGLLYYLHEYSARAAQEVSAAVQLNFQPTVLTTIRAANRISWYANGRMVYGPSTALTPPTDGDSGWFAIGGRNATVSGTVTFDGSISDVALYARALTDAEVILQHRTIMGAL